MIQTKRVVLSLALCGFFATAILSCSSNDDDGSGEEQQTASVEAGRQKQVDAFYDSQISMQQEQHVALTAELHVRAQAFQNAPTQQNLTALKAAWKSAFLQWKEMEFYKIGIIESSFIHTRIHQWPVNTAFIEDKIATDLAIDNTYINGLGASSKGYGAVEYLLYNGDDAAVLEDFTLSENNSKRMDYLVALAENLNVQAIALQDLWTTYETTFKSRLETGVNGSQNNLVNVIIAGLETIKLKKIGQSDVSITDASELEAFYSMTSKEAVAANLEALYESYTGDFTAEGYGMEEFVVEVLNNDSLNSNIITAFENTIAAFNAIDGDLETAVVNNAASLVKFREELTSLIVYFKTDLASAANVVVTFSDNDGDSG
ncbi:MAG: hypothetical protein CL868_02185 [Cytophagaceae bacterium]|nr:hypothetical protein [Cytophagaceae bacterium]|tara:strand:- start:14267 stop:15388 length:1122 start_codon:yes stop_codon:yes gene_type:complete